MGCSYGYGHLLVVTGAHLDSKGHCSQNSTVIDISNIRFTYIKYQIFRVRSHDYTGGISNRSMCYGC